MGIAESSTIRLVAALQGLSFLPNVVDITINSIGHLVLQERSCQALVHFAQGLACLKDVVPLVI